MTAVIMAANTRIIMMMTTLTLASVWLAAAPCAADVIIMDRVLNETLDLMADMPSVFGPQLSMIGMKGLLHMSRPLHACGPVHRPPPIPQEVPATYSRWIALIHRNNCTYSTKVLNAQAAGYSAVIVMNIDSDFIEPMSASPGDADNVTIPSVFIGQSDGDTLELYFKDYSRFGIIITGELPFNIQSYLLPFAITVAICFLGMLICMIVKCIRDYRRSLRHRLSWASLRRLPLHKFRAGIDPYEVCAICLEDYVEGDKLRILPCNHAYHSRCIDPWLTKRRRVCPVCKQKVRVGGETAADDTDDEDTDTERSTSERAPLLQQATQVSSGTFSTNRENPFTRASRRSEERRQRNRERPGYGRLEDDSINNASDVSSLGSTLSDGRHGSTDADDQGSGGTPGVHRDESLVNGVSATSMLPGQDDHVDEDLDVVTITRSIKKKNKKKKSKKSKRSDEESTTDVEGGEACVVQVDPAVASVEADASGGHHSGSDLIV